MDTQITQPKKKILIISHGEIGTQMAGTGIRYHYMAEVLSKDFDVTVGFFSPEYLPDAEFERSYNVESVDVHRFHEAFKQADIIIALWVSEAIIDFCNNEGKILIFDIYAPVPVENLALKIFSGKSVTEEDEFVYESSLKDYRKFFENGDAFLCSNQRQVDYWLGYVFGANQVTPKTYARRDVFAQMLIAPMGIDTTIQLNQGKPMYKGVIPGVAENDIVIVWNGGIYDWYDGVTLIDAMELVWTMNPHIKMIFPGLVHPNKNLPKWQESLDTQKRAKTLGLVGKNVFFFDKWIDYHKRLDFLHEADMAIYTHKPSIESEFSHRTRVLDHILACLPTIATKGDHFASVIEQNELGMTVPAYDKKALADAIVEQAKPVNLHKAQKALQQIRSEFDWQVTLAPLIEYIKSNPSKAPQIRPLQPSPLQSKKFRLAKRYTPLVVKKAVARTMPRKLRKKLLG